MSEPLRTGAIHHVRLTVNDVDRSRTFYMQTLGFTAVMELPPGTLLTNGTVLLGLAPPPGQTGPDEQDRFDENRVGLDHLALSVDSQRDLERAVQILDSANVPHGEITDLGPDLGCYVLSFRDPDNIQLELLAPRT